MEYLGLHQTSHFWIFFVFVAGIILLPGMDMAYILANTLSNGIKSGLSALAGIVVGGILHVVMAALGVGVVLKTFPAIFNAMLIAGTTYIIWIGISLMKSKSGLKMDTNIIQTNMSHFSIFRRGVATCLLNPKAYLFMLAIFPQFIRPEYGSFISQIIILSTIIWITQIVIYGAVALAAAKVKNLLQTNQTGQVNLSKGVGLFLIIIAIVMLCHSWNNFV